MEKTLDERKTNLPPVQAEVKSGTRQSILTINGGSSSIKFALYQTGEPLKRELHGKIDRIGLSDASLTFNRSTGNQQAGRSLAVSDHKSAGKFLIDWFEEQHGFDRSRPWDTGWSTA